MTTPPKTVPGAKAPQKTPHSRHTPAAGPACTPVFQGEALVDVQVVRGGRTLSMLGSGGGARECAFLPSEAALAEALDQRHHLTDQIAGLGGV